MHSFKSFKCHWYNYCNAKNVNVVRSAFLSKKLLFSFLKLNLNYHGNIYSNEPIFFQDPSNIVKMDMRFQNLTLNSICEKNQHFNMRK